MAAPSRSASSAAAADTAAAPEPQATGTGTACDEHGHAEGGEPDAPPPVTPASARAIVVLGQSLNADGTPPATLLARVRVAAERMRAAPPAMVVLCGGDPMETGEATNPQHAAALVCGAPRTHARRMTNAR